MNRLYVAESMTSPTGALADHRIPVRAGQIDAVARALSAAVSGSSGTGTGSPDLDKWIAAAAADLTAHRGRSVVVAGPAQPAAVHAIVHAINHALGNTGATIVHTEVPAGTVADQTRSLRELVADMNSGQVQLLVILGGNPVYTAPVDLKFADAMKKVPVRAHLSLYDNETSALCQWHVNETHYLEHWSDARAFDGSASIVQPLVEPLYHGHCAHDVATVFTKRPERTARDAVREYWKAQPQAAGQDFEKFWRKCLHDGVVAGTAATRIRGDSHRHRAAAATGPREGERSRDRLCARHGGLRRALRQRRLADGVAAAADEADVGQRRHPVAGDCQAARRRDRRRRRDLVRRPHGHRPRSGAAGARSGRGDGAPRIRARACGPRGQWHRIQCLRDSHRGCAVDRIGRCPPEDWRSTAACRHARPSLHGWPRHRPHGTIGDFNADPEFPHHLGEEPPHSLSMYNDTDHKYEGYSWGLSIDQSVCTGCSACVVACVAENNTPVIGKAQVSRGREMQWLRIDRYFDGDPDNPGIHHQPMLCQHCENAPCEVVCPVTATTHSPEGLNEMTYNRCVGTRYARTTARTKCGGSTSFSTRTSIRRA